MKKKLPVLLFAAFIVLLIVSFYLRKRVDELTSPLSKKPTDSSFIYTPQLSNPDNPIIKLIADDRGEVLYQMRGKFVDGLKERKVDKAYTGNFVIAGDPINRKIPIILSSEVFLGKYKENFLSESVWNWTKVSEIKQKLDNKQEIILSIKFKYDKSEDVPDYILIGEDVLDHLLKDFNEKEHNYVIPKNFNPVSQKVGIIE